ncbi:MAG: adenylate kinase [Candidatus Dormibacter sp.]
MPVKPGDPLHLVLLGPPGSGKGTQATRLALARGIPSISTGEILRAQQESDTVHGGELSRYLVRGELVPDRLVIEIIRHRLGDPDASSGFILDGFPRTSAQGEALDSMLALLQRPIDLAIYLAISAAALIERLSHRHREDDRPAVVQHRIEIYLAQTAPLIEYYRRGDRLLAIDADRPADQVYDAIVTGLAGRH